MAQDQRAAGARVGAKPSAIFTDQQLESKRPIIERGIALAMLAFSYAGTVASMNGGFVSIQANGLELFRTLLALALQTTLTATQFSYRSDRGNYFYIASIVIDVGLTFAAYRPILHSPISGALSVIPGVDAVSGIGADLIIALLATLFAALPENRLVQSEKK